MWTKGRGASNGEWKEAADHLWTETDGGEKRLSQTTIFQVLEEAFTSQQYMVGAGQFFSFFSLSFAEKLNDTRGGLSSLLLSLSSARR